MSTAYDYFTYTPIHGAPETAAVVFFVLGLILVFQTLNTQAARWMYILVGTAMAESLGYIFRAVCIDHISLALFICMNLFLLLPPNALALFNYKTVGEVARRSNAICKHFYLRPKFITWFFFSSDVFSFLLQSTGASMMAQDSTVKLGRWICLVGLAIQLVFLATFVLVTVAIARNPDYFVMCGPKDTTERAAKRRLMRTVFVTTALIYIRSIYRLIEFIDGYGGKIYSAEWAFYVFDCIVILLTFAWYIIYFVGYHFPRKSNIVNNGSAIELV